MRYLITTLGLHFIDHANPEGDEPSFFDLRERQGIPDEFMKVGLLLWNKDHYEYTALGEQARDILNYLRDRWETPAQWTLLASDVRYLTDNRPDPDTILWLARYGYVAKF